MVGESAVSGAQSVICRATCPIFMSLLLAMLDLGLFFVKHLRPPVQPPPPLQSVAFPPGTGGFLVGKEKEGNQL